VRQHSTSAGVSTGLREFLPEVVPSSYACGIRSVARRPSLATRTAHGFEVFLAAFRRRTQISPRDGGGLGMGLSESR